MLFQPTTLYSGQPSLCYHYYGDGICESFELTNNLEDCGHRTPLNYTDHWMTSSSAGPGGVDPMFMGPCSADVVTGPPSMHVVSNSSLFVLLRLVSQIYVSIISVYLGVFIVRIMGIKTVHKYSHNFISVTYEYI